MPTLSLSRPVENLRSAEEANVIALIDHLVPVLDDWRKGEDLRNELTEIEASFAPNQKQMSDAKGRLATVEEVRDGVYSKFDSYGKVPVGMLAIGVVLVVWGIITSSFFFILFGAGLVIAGIVVGRSSATGRFRALAQQAGQIEAEIASIDTARQRAEARKAQVEGDIASRSGGFPEVWVADLHFLMKTAKVAGRRVLLDLSGVGTETVLKAVDVSGLQAGLKDISNMASALLDVPPMLAPGDLANVDDPVHQLFGEESDLQELVTEFSLQLRKIRDVSLKLPLVSPRNIITQRLTAVDHRKAGVHRAHDGPVIALSSKSASPQETQAFVDEVERSRQTGAQVFSDLQEVFNNLESACLLYANSRTTSVNIIHQNLTEVLNRASWCNRRFYCPRTILSPQYLQDLLGVVPDDAYMLSFDDLVERLRSDSEISKRLADKQELETQLSDAYDSVQNFLNEGTFAGDGNADDGRARPRHIEEQFRESVKLFANVLNKIMTGSSYPILNFSSEARVFFDPESDEWRSDVVPYTYTTANILKYGGVVKAYSDLMLPLWEHLWTEKADFRKSELFRTNESMIRMTEKESEKLIDIGNQFRADMRTVRENVYLLESELNSKHVEIVNFRDSMSELNLLSERAKVAVSDDKLKGMIIGEPVIPKMDKCESIISLLPQSQAENRGTAHDPIDMIKEPDALIGYQGNVGIRLLAV